MLKLFVNALRAADETHAGATVAPFVNRRLGGGGDSRMLRKTKIVVGAKIQHRLAVGHTDGGALRRDDDALVFVSAGFADLGELGFEIGFVGEHKLKKCCVIIPKNHLRPGMITRFRTSLEIWCDLCVASE